MQVGRDRDRRRSCVVAALLLVGNTIRLAAFARRKEIGIMRLVGASTLYIALPFLLEALVTALIGVALAGGRARRRSCTSAIEQRLRRPRRVSSRGSSWDDAMPGAVLVIAILGPVLTLIPTLLLTRKYLKV